MNIIAITGAAVCVSFLALSVKSVKKDMGQLISLAAVICIMAAMIPYIRQVVAAIRELSSYSEMGEKYMEPILKITGIAYISRLGSELCADCGEGAFASRVEMAGKIAIGVITIPVAREAFSKIMGILT